MMNRLLKKPLVSGKRLGFHPSLSRSIFIQTETTPNPHSMKFIPGDEVLPERFGTGMYFQKTDIRDLQKSPLAKLLFTIDGVKSIFFARDVITITKDTDVVWTVLKPQLFSKILDFYGDANPQVMIDSAQMGVSDTAILDDDDEVVAMIKELIETRVRPAVQDDGGDIYYEGFDADRGIVKVRLAGSCVGCPSSSITLKNGVEQMLRHYIAEVEGVEEVGAVDEDGELIPDTEMKLSHTPIN